MKLTLEQGIALLNKGKRLVRFQGEEIHLSNAVLTYRRGVDCWGCGAKGEHFTLHNGVLKLKVRHSGNLTHMQSDHIWPKAKGGPNAQWNRQPLCKICNRNKSNHLKLKQLLNEHISVVLKMYQKKPKTVRKYLPASTISMLDLIIGDIGSLQTSRGFGYKLPYKEAA